MTEMETERPAGGQDGGTRWLAGPPPPPPDGDGADGAAGDAIGSTGVGPAARTPRSTTHQGLSADHVRAESPWMLASAGVLFALAAYWAGSLVAAFQHGSHITGQERALRVFAPGSLIWVLGAILAVALFAAGRRFELPPAPAGPLRSVLAMALVLASAAAVASAAMCIVVELANFGNGIAAALAGLIGYAGTLVLAGALAYWANREHAASTGGHT